MQNFIKKSLRSITHHKRRNPQGDIERHFTVYTEEKALNMFMLSASDSRRFSMGNSAGQWIAERENTQLVR
jgi:hypothetical protein